MIAIGGLKNAGKDTMAKMLQFCLSTPCWMHNYTLYKWFGKFVIPKYNITSFAKYLKTSLAEVIGVDVEKLNDRDFKENYYISFQTLNITNCPPTRGWLSDKSFSRHLQKGDLEFIKQYYISIRQLLQLWGSEVIRNTFGDKIWILRTLKDNDNIIVSDLRFKVEYESVKFYRGTTVYINRNCEPGQHQSEKEVLDLYNDKKFDYVIHNTGTLKDLFYQTSKFVKLWQKAQS